MANSSSTHAPDVRRDTILVVDDTPETLGFLTDTLDHAGFTALIATDGESALRLIEQITPDLVLMDAVMPGLNGFETCRRMKRNKMLGGLPVIFMTGLTETENVLEGLAAGGRTRCGDGAGAVVAGADLTEPEGGGNGYRHQAGGRGAIAQLAAVVEAPAVDPSIQGYAAGVGLAGAHLGEHQG